MLVVGEGKSTTENKIAFLSNLLSLGYEVAESHKFNDSILENYSSILFELKKMKAGHVDYVPLFLNFPEETPELDSHFLKRFVGLYSNYFGIITEGKEMDSGVIVPEWLFDLENFGADPLTQFQDRALFENGIEKQNERKDDVNVVLHKLRFVTQDEANRIGIEYLNDIICANSSIKETLKEDVEALLEIFGSKSIDIEGVTFKETKAYLLQYFWEKQDYEAVSNLVTSPTDLLRLFAKLTDGDISLSQEIKFPKFKTRQRKIIIKILDRFSNLAEDLNRHRGLWLSIGKGLHVGVYKNKFPNAVNAFNKLRNEKIETWNSKLEQRFEEKSFDGVLELLIKRPGEFARRLHHVLRLANSHKEAKEAIELFRSVSNKVPLKTLLLLESYFLSFNKLNKRAFFNKKGKIKVISNNLPKIESKTHKVLNGIINTAIEEKIKNEKPSWEGKKVWVDESLKTLTVPLQQRKASESFLTFGRGSRIKFKDDKVLRLFVWWKQKYNRTDLDLSVVTFDKQMDYLGHVSYTRLRNGSMVHSGDITSAPYGAAEFIDIEIDSLGSDVRYVAPQIYRFAGDSFADMDECYAGWMVREKTDSSRKSFDIKTVKNAVSLNGFSAYNIPMLVDIKDKEIIFVDLYIKGRQFGNNVENSLNSVSVVSQEVSRMIETKPNIWRLVEHNYKARGAEIISNKEEADITIGFEDCDYNALEAENILSEFL